MIELMIPALTLFTSLVVLAVASFFAIKYVEDFIEITRLSEVAAGFIILAIMTCMPELTVAIFAMYATDCSYFCHIPRDSGNQYR